MDYYKRLKEDRFETKANYGNWDAAQKHIEAYFPKHITLNDVDVDFIKGFIKYLDTVAVTKSHKKLCQNTKHTYFNKFKACLNTAIDEGFLKENLMKKVKGFAMGESTREYLISNELQKLASTP